jgi:hypothetical protein
MPSVETSLAEIHGQIADMRVRASAPEADLLRTIPNISAWCAAQHLDHLTRASISIFRKLATPAAVDRGITLAGRIVLGLGWIPRGRGRSPESLRGVCATPDSLLLALDDLEGFAKGVDAAALDATRTPVVRHPKFGGLTPSQALRFVSIHNAHHLAILDDIARA